MVGWEGRDGSEVMCGGQEESLEGLWQELEICGESCLICIWE